MIAVRIKSRSEMGSGSPVRIKDVAYVVSDAKVNAGALTLPMPRDTGIWLVDAGSILSAIYKHYPSETVRLTGDSIGWLRRRPERTIRARGREWLRLICASVFGLINVREPRVPQLAGGAIHDAANSALAAKGEPNPEAST
ncbi:MAG: hypothetical protein LBS11_09730 [Oscillospiraceae bacterium]|jgi:hypothetical protein|nr:hypothetical protein [Oscillospiraceae bacterium]